MAGKSRGAAVGAITLLVCSALAYSAINSRLSVHPDDVANIPLRKNIEGAPLCPWRDPHNDLRRFFPNATRYKTQSMILSDRIVELRRRLGRLPSPEENPLQVHPIFRGAQPLGTVIVRRIKGEYGAIEVVAALDSAGRVHGLRFQRIREPQPVRTVLSSPHWLHRFIGKSSGDNWTDSLKAMDVPVAAQNSARAVTDGIHSLLILNEVAMHIPARNAGQVAVAPQGRI